MLEKIEEMLGAVESYPDPGMRETTRDLVRELLDFHRAGLARMIELSGDGERLAADPQVAPVLLLHGLHPEALGVRVERALE